MTLHKMALEGEEGKKKARKCRKVCRVEHATDSSRRRRLRQNIFRVLFSLFKWRSRFFLQKEMSGGWEKEKEEEEEKEADLIEEGN